MRPLRLLLLPLPLLLVLLLPLTAAYEVPPALAELYANLTSSKSRCASYVSNQNNLDDGHGFSGFGFCLDVPGALYLRGPRAQLGDMDVDCDGSSNCEGKSKDYQSGTAFDDVLAGQNYGIASLDAEVHPYVVLGTCSADVAKVVKPLSVVAVVCNRKLHYAVWGDTNGCDDDNFTGEASLALARLCFPDEGVSGDNGHTPHDVLYLAFTDEAAVPGPTGAKWKAANASEFEESLKILGDRMVNETVKRAQEAGVAASMHAELWRTGLMVVFAVLAGDWYL
ncbi:fungal chitosanase of glycosyl hydrolase group 75-domain-containing protein [Sphaerosporella brunnea]|uniref:Endo-chitosanase n=1 Tax=Sphaerosporella brunnea TaxID=1250544 RepID=A0A5J5EUF5_9PEZI|nr:fungal chitosanase of glycosyl hydrolase group 75-domain-containing protein [Sphaerosporella brunnea]